MLFGFLAGLSILAGALAFGHVPLHLIFNVEAILIVIGGTITATLVSFNQQTLVHAFRAFKSCFHKNTLSPEYCLDMVIEISNFVRTEDLLALQPLIESIDSPFLRKGLKLVIDNRSETFIQSSLTTEIETVYREQLDNARVFETAGGFAPTMGIIGAVIGLIYVAQSFENPAQLGEGVASAFSATLYGVALSNLFLLPIASKLKQRARDEWFIKTLLLEGIMSIQAEDHPFVLEEKLTAFVSKTALTDSQDAFNKPYGTGPDAFDIMGGAGFDESDAYSNRQYEPAMDDYNRF